VAAVVAISLGLGADRAAAAWIGDVPCLVIPVAGDIVERFVEPPCPYCAGRRGIVIRTGRGVPVGAAAPGTVSFAGAVAGTLYVVVAHGGGWRTTYGGLASIRVRAGERVAVLETVGISAGRVHLGVRQGGDYVDPLPLLGRPAVRARLVPAHRRAARASAGDTRRRGCPSSPAGVPRGAAGAARR
jgi:hypothetical protein